MKHILSIFIVAGTAVGMAAAAVAPVQAATVTDTFTARIQIQADCEITSPTDLDFGTQGVLSSNVDATATFNVTCTSGVGYNIGLNEGTTVGGSIATRKMTDGTNTVDYRMYSDSGHTTNWGDTVGTDTVAATGSGSTQSYTIYGRVPAQTTPPVGTYTDTVTITVTY